MINYHYKNRYNKFIENIRSVEPRVIDGYSENHHIIPRCLNGSESPNNLIKLTLREHHLAHWLLWKAYPNSLSLASAFLQMNNKNPFTNKSGFKPIPSKVYEALKTQVYNSLSKSRFDKVYVYDHNGILVEMTKKEYAEQNAFLFHTTGKLVVYDVQMDTHVSITTTEYYANKCRYIPNVSSSKCYYTFLNIETNSIEKMPKQLAKKLNEAAGYKKYKQQVNHKLKCTDDEGNILQLTLEEYRTGKYRHYKTNTVTVFDKITQCNKSITKEEYLSDTERYITSTRGKVLVKNNKGKSLLVTKEEFATENYVGHTAGLRTVYDTNVRKYVQITEQEWNANRSRYVGPNKGKVNVVNKITGVRSQITKDQFNKAIYASLGDRSMLFRARSILTGKEKNINIYEWDHVKTKYDIIDIDQFNYAMTKKK